MTLSTPRIDELKQHVGRTATVRGWVTHLRSSGKIAFVVMRDGTGQIQGVLVKNADRTGSLGTFRGANHRDLGRHDRRGAHRSALARRLRDWRSPISRSSARVQWTIRSSRKSTASIFCSTIDTSGSASPRQRAIVRVRHEVEQAIHDFFYERGFLRVDTPILTAAIGERCGTLFDRVLRRRQRIPRANGTAIR